jgi:hypothetical protein
LDGLGQISTLNEKTLDEKPRLSYKKKDTESPPKAVFWPPRRFTVKHLKSCFGVLQRYIIKSNINKQIALCN